jgi:sialic acid synthase SpsE
VDSAFSMEPAEFAMLRAEADRAWQSVGSVRFGGTQAEEGSRAYRRSLYVGMDMAEGDVFTADNLRIIRPGHGLPPKFYPTMLGKRIKRAVKAGTPVDWDLLA